MFGVSSAPEIFQKILEKILAGLHGCANAFDDILVWGRTKEDHDARLAAALKRLEEHNVLLNQEKCLYRATEVPFLGHILSSEGVRMSPSKVDAIQKFTAPTTAEHVRSFLGMVTFLGQYIPNLATISNDLRILLKKETPFTWGPNQQKSFDELKAHLMSSQVLGYFDLDDRTQLFVDASPVGLGAVLIQIARKGQRQGQPRMITYASKSLTETEQRYCQTEKEPLAIVWGIEHNHHGSCQTVNQIVASVHRCAQKP